MNADFRKRLRGLQLVMPMGLFFLSSHCSCRLPTSPRASSGFIGSPVEQALISASGTKSGTTLDAHDSSERQA